MKKKVMVGMSGGVDSSVAALLLLQQGYEVVGVTMKLRPETPAFQNSHGSCGASQDIADAKRVADQLGIPHLTLDLTQRFTSQVVDYFVAEYEKGRTPNPCIACNANIKFGAMLEEALALGCDYIATGHYGKICQDKNGRWLLKKAPASKDQSYVLYHLTQHQLSHILLPLASMEKSQARKLAEEAGLQVAHKPDSQEICFVPDNDYSAFLYRYTGRQPQPGNFIDQSGTVLGRHKGISCYTIGQRKGLGLSFGKPMFVTKIDPQTNTVTLGENGAQYADGLIAGRVNLIPFDVLHQPLRAQVKVRYQAAPADALLTAMENGNFRVEFDSPQRSVTPGQAAVFYDGDLVLGGGTIERPLKK